MNTNATELSVTGLILAGGAGKRVSAQDKGLLHFRGASLVEHVARRLRPQVGRLLISCNRNHAQYRQYADAVVDDLRDNFQGPLAGIEAALPVLETDILLICPCDAPLLPEDLALRLTSPFHHSGTAVCDVCYAHDGQRDQYLFAACSRDCLEGLPDFLHAGGRAVRDWYQLCRVERVDFSGQNAAFANYNTLDELSACDNV